MAVLVESMHRITIPKYEIRIWRSEPPEYQFSPEPLNSLHALAHRNQDLPIADLARRLLHEENVNAVEVLNWDRSGIVVYKDWP